MTERTRPGREPTVGQLMIQICRLVGDRMRVKLEGIGLHRAQGFALFFLAHHEGVRQTEIARSLHLSAASVTTMLQRMERDGWIERRPDPEDQRASRVYLTQRARGLREEAEAAFRELEQEVTSALTAEEGAKLQTMLVKVRARILQDAPPGRGHAFAFGDAEGEES